MNRYTALQLIDLQVSTLFVCDVDGRLRYIREPGYEESELESAPRFFMGRTLQGNTWRFRYDLPDSLVQPIEQLCRSEPVAVDFADPPQNAAAIRAILNEHAPITNEERGPAYSIPDSVRAPFGAGDMPARLWRAGHLPFAGTGCSRCIVPGGESRLAGRGAQAGYGALRGGLVHCVRVSHPGSSSAPAGTVLANSSSVIRMKSRPRLKRFRVPLSPSPLSVSGNAPRNGYN